MPNDETEQERLDMTHHVFTLTLDGDICVTQLHNPQAILDIGTGTGMWVRVPCISVPSPRRLRGVAMVADGTINRL